MNLPAPSLDLVILTLAAFAVVGAGVVWLLRRAIRGTRQPQTENAPSVTQRLDHVETDLRALEDSTDYLADTLRVPPPAGREVPAPRRSPRDTH